MPHNLCVNVSTDYVFGTFVISAKRTDNTCELVFENDLVDDVDTKAIFERFYTKDNGGSGRDTGLACYCAEPVKVCRVPCLHKRKRIGWPFIRFSRLLDYFRMIACIR